jgi:hypothetical protein
VPDADPTPLLYDGAYGSFANVVPGLAIKY